MDETKNKKRTWKEKIMYIFLAIICSYFALTIGLVEPTDVDISLFNALFVIFIVIGYFVIPFIFKAYYWVFVKVSKLDRINKRLLTQPIMICSGLLSVIVISFVVLLTKFLVKMNSFGLTDRRWDAVAISAKSTLIPLRSIIPYIMLICIICILIVQVYHLYKQKIIFPKSLIASIISLATFLFLLDWFVYILDNFTIIPLLLLKGVGLG